MGDPRNKDIAVFGDTHGHLRLMFQLCRLWQLDHGKKLDGVLQCGDLGFFPDPGNLDRATWNFVKKDPEELGFARYFMWPEPPERDGLLERILSGPPGDLDTVSCPVLWCHGNHEDFEELERMVGSQPRAAIDAFGILELLQSGHVTQVAGVRTAALGGAPEEPGEPVSGEGARGSRLGQRVSAQACHRLSAQSFDVLISHGAARGVDETSEELGSGRVRSVIETCQPAYHFYGHHSQPIPPATIGRTRCYWLGDVNFKHVKGYPRGSLKPGCMGLLSWRGPEAHHFEVLDEPWMKEVTGLQWEDL